MCHRSRTVLCLLAAGSGLLLVASLLLPTMVVAFMIIHNLFLADGFGFTIVGLAAVAMIGLCTLAEAMAARKLLEKAS